MNRPRIGITMGDPAGVGPEVVVKALSHPAVYAECRPLVIGDRRRLARACAITGRASAVRPVPSPAEGCFAPGTLDCIDLGLVPEDLPFGALSALAGEAAQRYVERAAALALEGSIDAICTAPLNKEALNAAGHRYPGHTELLAELTGTKEVSLMLLAPKLCVIHVTTHIGLLDGGDDGVTKFFEIAHPLDTADDPHDLGAAPGDRVQVLVLAAGCNAVDCGVPAELQRRVFLAAPGLFFLGDQEASDTSDWTSSAP